MSNVDVKLVFGVQGGGSLSGASGKEIKQRLTELVNNLASKGIPKIKLFFDDKSIQQELKRIQKIFKEQFNFSPTIKNSGNAGSAKGGSKNQRSDYLKDQDRQLNEWAEKINKINKLQSEMFKSSKSQGSEYYQKLKEELAKYQKELESFNQGNTGSLAKKRVSQLKDQLNSGQIKNERLLQDELSKSENAYNKTVTRIGEYIERIDVKTKEGKDALAKLRAEMEKPVANNMSDLTDDQKLEAYNKKVKELNTLLLQTSSELNRTGAIGQTVWGKLGKAITNKFFQAVSASLIALGSRAITQVYRNVLELDKAITDLQIATGKTREETEELIKTYSDLAQELGATITEVSAAADTWLRQGYSIAETNKLITATMHLSKLGQMESAEAAKALTSAMKGYKEEVADAMSIVDKFTAVDMEAAINAGDIATAMAETAAGADIAGVKMDTLIGYIATVGEVTQDGAESVGTFFKTLFARMGNVKAGSFIDPETGESLNDVEKVLNGVGISLRNRRGEFRDFSRVLDDVAEHWDYYDNVQQHAIATAFAGTRQQEKFIVLMENYGSAMEYAATSAESAGTAQSKYQEAYMDSIDAKLNKLTATWQEFSSNLLDSELIKFGVDFLQTIAQALSGILSVGDGILIIIPAIIGGLLLMHATMIKIKSTQIFTTIWTDLKIMASWIVKVITAMKSWTVATHAQAAANTAMNLTNPVGWITLALGAIVALTAAFASFSNQSKKAEERTKKLQETAEASKKEAEEAAETTRDLIACISEYKDLIQGFESVNDLDAETRQEVLDIQQQITDLVGKEAADLDLVNDSFEESLKKLKEIKAESANSEYTKALGAYGDAEDASNYAYFTSRADVSGLAWQGHPLDYQIVFERGDDASQHADEIAEMISGIKGVTWVDKGSVIGDKFYGMDLWSDLTTEDSVNVLTQIIDMIDAKGWAVSDQEIYNQFVALRQQYIDTLTARDTGLENLLNATVSKQGWDLYKNTDGDITDIDQYDVFRNNIINAVKEDKYIREGGVALEEIETSVDNWLSSYFSRLYNEKVELLKPKIISAKSYIDILDEIQDEYDALSEALEEFEEKGILTRDTIKDLMEDFPELYSYLEESGALTLGEDGYILDQNALDNYIEHVRQQYEQAIADATDKRISIEAALASGEGDEATLKNDLKIAQDSEANAIQNLENFEIVANTLDKALVEKYVQMLEEQSDAIEEQKGKYKDLINTRKELLETYADEIKKQQELEKKQQNVADLQTKLRLAQLDTSTGGQARARELEAELKEAQEDLSEYTLEQAIEELTADLDNEYKEYETFIGKRLKSIEDAINSAADKTASELRDIVKGGNINEYHTGGFVGNIKPLKSNEEFAKLLNGELVVTPVQMSNFMNKTLPGMTSGVNGVVNYNSPLITINCDNVSKDSLPGLENIVNKAVKKIKEQIDSKFSRNGKKGSIDAFII